jgi:hypothetical protein
MALELGAMSAAAMQWSYSAAIAHRRAGPFSGKVDTGFPPENATN